MIPFSQKDFIRDICVAQTADKVMQILSSFPQTLNAKEMIEEAAGGGQHH